MKKWLLTGWFVLWASALWAQNSFMFGGSPTDTGKAFRGFAKELGTFRVEYDKFYINLQVLTRETTDSLTVTIQTKAADDVASDTGWVTLRQFGGAGAGIVATGTTAWKATWNAASDTSAMSPAVWTYARIMVNHGDAAGSCLASDSSRFRLLIRNYGNKIAR